MALRRTGQASAAESGAISPDTDHFDPGLALVVERWTDLPEAIRAGIVAMVRAAGG